MRHHVPSRLLPFVVRTAVLAAAMAGCEPLAPAYDLGRPHVIEVAPAPGAAGVDPEAPVELAFDEPVGPLDEAHVVLAPAAAVTQTFRADLDSKGLGSRALGAVVPCTVTVLDDGRRVRLEHPPLDRDVVYAILVSADVTDATGNSLAGEDGEPAGFESRFTTAAPGPTATLVVPDTTSRSIPPNLSEVVVTFDRELRALFADGVRVEDADGRLVPGESFLSSDRRRIRRTLTERLAPGVRHAVVLGHLFDADGAPATGGPWGFEVAACTDERPPAIAEASVAALDFTAIVTVRTDEPGAASVHARALDTCAGTATATTAAAVCEGIVDPCGDTPAAGGCIANVTLRGLCSEGRYEVTPVFTDTAGHVSEGAPITFQTLAPSARPAITEVLVDAAASEADGEFVELLNDSSEPWDLSGWTLVKITGTGETPRTLARQDGVSGPLPGRATAIYATRSFEAARYGGLPSSAVLIEGVTTNPERSVFGNGLSNTNPPRLELRGPGGGVFSWWPAGVKCPEGQSAARSPGSDVAPACGTPTPGVGGG